MRIPVHPFVLVPLLTELVTKLDIAWIRQRDRRGLWLIHTTHLACDLCRQPHPDDCV
jgi:hypothetical protein